jgi:hypothetical protein
MQEFDVTRQITRRILTIAQSGDTTGLTRASEIATTELVSRLGRESILKGTAGTGAQTRAGTATSKAQSSRLRYGATYQPTT